jgi:hypothetical protein
MFNTSEMIFGTTLGVVPMRLVALLGDFPPPTAIKKEKNNFFAEYP